MKNVTKPNAIICMAAGVQQIPVIKAAIKMGLQVICIDRDTSAPGLIYCNKKIRASTYDAVAFLHEIEKIKKQYTIVSVLNRSSGPPVVSTAIINRELGLLSTPPDMAGDILNKDRLRLRCRERGLPIPEFLCLGSKDDIDGLNFPLPCIIKPALSLVGKAGIRYVESREKLNSAIGNAFAKTANGNVLVEEYIEGKDVILLSVVKNKQLYPLFLLDEINTLDNGNIRPFSLALPTEHVGLFNRIVELAGQTIKEFKVDNSPFNLSCRRDMKGNLKIIEIHLDIGGDNIYDSLIPKSVSFNAFEYIIGCLAFGKCQLSHKKIQPTAIVFAQGRQGRFKYLQAKSRQQLNSKLSYEVYT